MALNFPSRGRCVARSALAIIAISVAVAPVAALAQINYVITVSIDGLRSDAITTLGPADAPNFYRLRNEGAFTDNARTDYDHTNTLPNHVTMLTGRRVNTSIGHNWTTNTDPAPNQTLHNNKGSYVASVFDVAHDNGLRTALYSGKTKFVLFATSYNGTNGALDTTGPDNGRNKIDRTIINFDSEALTASFITGMEALPYNFSMLHFADPDEAGHANNWDVVNFNSPYLNSVRAVDSYLGMVLSSIESHPSLVGRTALVVIADHGGIQGTNNHIDATNFQNYTMPFYAWGPGIPSGADLYAMNSGTRLDPSTGRPDYSEPIQPIRTGDLANMALDLLGLGSVPGSTINSQQNLTVRNPFPTGDYNYDGEVDGNDYLIWRQQFGSLGKRAADGNGDSVVDAADYIVWRRYASTSVNGASAAATSFLQTVPEPAAAVVVLFAVFLSTVFRITRRRSALIVTSLLVAISSAGSHAAVIYPGNGGNSFGGALSNGTLTIDDSPDGTINFNFQTGGSFSRNLVLYIDCKPGGYANNYLMDYAPGSDNQRAASGFNESTKVHALMQFAPAFKADYAVALWVRTNTPGSPSGSLRTLTLGMGADAGRVVLTNTVDISLTGSQSTGATFRFNAADIGLAPGAGESFRFIATYLNGSNAVRSNEFIGGVARSTPYDGNGNVASVTMADYRTYTLLGSAGQASSAVEALHTVAPEPALAHLALIASLMLLRLRSNRSECGAYKNDRVGGRSGQRQVASGPDAG